MNSTPCQHTWVSGDHPPQVVGVIVCNKCRQIRSAGREQDPDPAGDATPRTEAFLATLSTISPMNWRAIEFVRESMRMLERQSAERASLLNNASIVIRALTNQRGEPTDVVKEEARQWERELREYLSK